MAKILVIRCVWVGEQLVSVDLLVCIGEESADERKRLISSFCFTVTHSTAVGDVSNCLHFSPLPLPTTN